jgi:hypothetical protein
MEKVGMGVDLSHCGDQTTLDALDAAFWQIVPAFSASFKKQGSALIEELRWREHHRGLEL